MGFSFYPEHVWAHHARCRVSTPRQITHFVFMIQYPDGPTLPTGVSGPRCRHSGLFPRRKEYGEERESEMHKLGLLWKDAGMRGKGCSR